MEMKKRLKAMKILIGISLVGSLGSVYTDKMKWGEIYPFFHWKLFSQPTGWDLKVIEHRIYGVKPNGESVRLKNQVRKTFTSDEINYTLEYLITLPEEKERNEKLKIFCRYLAPEFSSYKIVEEVYNPLVIMKDFDNYDKKTLFEIH